MQVKKEPEVGNKANLQDTLLELKKVFDHLCTIYNENTVLQDNVNRDEFLKTFSHLSSKKVLSMRMIEIIEMFKIQVNIENINEARLLVNDLNSLLIFNESSLNIKKYYKEKRIFI